MSLCKRCRWDYKESFLHADNGLCDSCQDIALREELATLLTERDELRRVLEWCLMYGQLPIAIADQARKLLEAK